MEEDGGDVKKRYKMFNRTVPEFKPCVGKRSGLYECMCTYVCVCVGDKHRLKSYFEIHIPSFQ